MLHRVSMVALVVLVALECAAAETVQSSLKAYIAGKVKGGNPVQGIVCNGLGTNPKSPTCFNGNGQAICGNNQQCPSPCKCWLAKPAKLSASNRIQTWKANDPTWSQIKNQLAKWNIPNEMYDSFEMATMADSGRFAKFHFYVQPDKKEARYELALGTARYLNSVVEIGYIYVKASAELAPVFYKCGKKKVKGGFLGLKKKTKRWCHDTGISNDRVEKIRQALEFFAFESIRFQSGGSVKEAVACKRVFNCRCYLARYPDLQKAFKGNCDKARAHYACSGKKVGGRRLIAEEDAGMNELQALLANRVSEDEGRRSLFTRGNNRLSRRILKGGSKPPPACGFGEKENRNPSCCDDSSMNRDEDEDFMLDMHDVREGIRNVQRSNVKVGLREEKDEADLVFELDENEVDEISEKVLFEVYGVNLGSQMIRPRHTLFKREQPFEFDRLDDVHPYVSSGYEP